LILDIVQFVHQSWVRRNRILDATGGWKYISVPVNKSHRETLIKDITISNSHNWKQDIINQMVVYRKIAPNYREVIDLLNYIFKNEYTHVSDLCQRSTEIVCNYLGIETEIKLFTNMNLTIEKPGATDEWALNICKAINEVDEYLNLPNGISFYDRSKYEKAGITIEFLRNHLKHYNQGTNGFEPGLSIIDVMMFNSRKEIHELLDDFELL